MRQLHLIEAADLPPLGVFGRDIALKDYRRYLGTTQGDVFYDAGKGLFPNAFAAVAGAIGAGHHLYLHLPAHYPDGDPDHRRWLAHGEAIETCADHFHQRLRRLAAQQNAAAAPPLAQHQAIARFSHPQPQIILGKRGSGKSHFLAQKINALADAEIAPLLLVSPFAQNRQTIAAHTQVPLLCLPPDEALRRLPAAQALIVDEAAALAPAQLIALCRHYPAFTLASTSDGYEGSAQHFCLNTLPALGIRQEQIVHLQGNYRHHSGDPLECLMNRLFLFPTGQAERLQSHEATEIIALQAQDLATDEQLLCSYWSLLNQAHYRSRPEDLKRLLDMPDQALFMAANAQGECLGVLQIALETPLDTALAQAVIAGERRPRGRLLMQQLLQRSGELHWAQQCFARVQRIAVHPDCRRRQIASRLLNAAHRQLADWQFGCVYSASPSLEAFWENNAYRLCYQAQHIRSRHQGASHIRLHQNFLTG